MVIDAVASNMYGLNWEADGTILYGQPEGILRVSATGGTSELIIPVTGSVNGARLLPDGDSVLFSVRTSGNWDEAQIVVQSLSTGERTVLIEGGSGARYLPTGHLVYTFQYGLFAVAFDLDSLTVSGGAVPLVQGVERAGGDTGAVQYGVSENGTLVYVPGDDSGQVTVVWVDREGREERIPAEPSSYFTLHISPDGSRVVLDDRNEDNDLWVWDFVSETRTRLTIGENGGANPAWTPDGTRIAYNPGTGDIDWKAANNTGRPERLATGLASPGGGANPKFFSPSGDELVFNTFGHPDTGNDIGMITVGGDSEPVWLLQEPYQERNAELSPDGRWMAYQSDESGQYEVYVRPFPNVNDNFWQVSNAGGFMPLWSRDGRELFYLERGPERLMSVSIDATETAFSFSSRTLILDWPYLGTFGTFNRPYDVADDGRFLAISIGGPNEDTSPIIVVENWFPELARLAPAAE